MGTWVVAMTKPGCERTAAENLTRQGYTHYLPRYLSAKPGTKPRILCLFPRYIFIHVEEFWYSIKGTYGISKLLLVDGKPASVPASFITAMQAREDKGLIDLTPKERFRPGQEVRVADGPLAGYSLFYQGMTGPERVRVLMELLGRKVSVELNEKSLSAA